MNVRGDVVWSHLNGETYSIHSETWKCHSKTSWTREQFNWSDYTAFNCMISSNTLHHKCWCESVSRVLLRLWGPFCCCEGGTGKHDTFYGHSACAHTSTNMCVLNLRFSVSPQAFHPWGKHLCFPHSAGPVFIYAALTFTQLCVKWTTLDVSVCFILVCVWERVCVCVQTKAHSSVSSMVGLFSIWGCKCCSRLGRCLR